MASDLEVGFESGRMMGRGRLRAISRTILGANLRDQFCSRRGYRYSDGISVWGELGGVFEGRGGSARTVTTARAGAYGLNVGLVWWVLGMILAAGYFRFCLPLFCWKSCRRQKPPRLLKRHIHEFD